MAVTNSRSSAITRVGGLLALAVWLWSVGPLPAAAAPADPPTAPRQVVAVAGVLSATVSWAPPESDGGGSVTSYVVRAIPGGVQVHMSGAARSAVIGGLRPGSAYTFTVTALNAAGSGLASSPSNAVVPLASGGQLNAVSPARVLDTRTGVGGIRGPVRGGQVATVRVAGRGGVPLTGAVAVVANVTVTAQTRAGHVTVFPAGQARPTVWSLSFTARQTVAGLVMVQLGAGGRISLFIPAGTAQLSVDISGWVSAVSAVRGSAGLLRPQVPVRILDTRVRLGGQAPHAGGTIRVKVTGRGGVPASGASAVVLNITATGASRSGYITVWPSGRARPRTPELKVSAGQTVSKRVVVPLGAGGTISIFNGTRSTVQLAADINGVVSGGGDQDVAVAGITPLAPTRLLDTRSELGGIGRPVGSDAPKLLTVAGHGGVPPAPRSIPATAVVATVTVMAPTTNGSLTVFPTGIDRPAAADLAFRRGQSVSNLVVAKLGSDGSLALAISAGRAHVMVDVFGYASGDTFVSPQAAVLPPSQVTDVVGPADGIRTVTVLVGGTPPHAGQIVAVDVGPEVPDGLLGQVENVATQGGTTVLTLAPATLDQAVPSGSIDIDAEFSADDVTGGGASPPSHPSAARITPLTPRELTIRAASGAPSPIGQRIARNVSCQGGGSISVDGDVSVTPSLHFDVRWGGVFHPGIQRASFTGDVTASARLSATARATVGCTLERTPLLRTPLRFRPITVNVGPVPVVLVPELQLWLMARGEIRAEVSASATASYTASAGLVWENGRLQPVSSISDRSSFQPPTPQATGGVSASFGPTLDLLIYGVAGPTLNLTATLALRASTSDTPWWKFTLTVDAGGGITIPALHFSKTRPDILHWSRVLARASTPPPPLPLEITTTTLGAGAIGRPYSQTLHATGGRTPYRWAVIGDRLPAGLTLDPAAGQILGTPTTAETTNPRIRVTDAGGATAEIILALTVVPPTTLADFDLHDDLSCDAHETGIAHSIFYGSSPRPACGTFIRVDGQGYGPALPAADIPGRRDYTPVEFLPPTGGGGTPHVFSATVAAGDTGVRITETDRYTDGDTSWTTSLRITSTSGTHTISVYRAADCYIDDNDFSSGGEDPATGAVSCQDAAHQISYVPDSRDGVHHLEAFYADVWGALGSPDPLPDTVRHDIHDSGLALQWQFTVDPTHPITVTSRSVLSVSPAHAAQAARTGMSAEGVAARTPKAHRRPSTSNVRQTTP